MEEIKDKDTIEKLKNAYINLFTCKNPYVTQGNFDYLKDNNLLCIPIFRGDDYVKNFFESIMNIFKKRNQKDFYTIQTHFVKERGGLVVDLFYSSYLTINNLRDIIKKFNLTECSFYFFEANIFLLYNDFDYYLIIAKKEDIEELTGLTIPELLEYTKEIDWYSDDRPEMYDTYKKFLEEVGAIKE